MNRPTSHGPTTNSLSSGTRRFPFRTLVSLLLVAQPLALGAAPSPVPARMEAPWRNQDDITFTRMKIEDGNGRVSRLTKIVEGVKHGETYSPEERAIIDAYRAGQAISNIEADVLISRALYHRYITGTPLTAEQSSLLDRYTEYTKTNQVELYNRRAQLHASFGIGIEAPEDSRAWELYSNPDLFNRLDGLQRVLEFRFGRKGGLTSGDDNANALASTYSVPQFSFTTPKDDSPASLLVSSLVNNPAADLGANDTQSETSLLMIPGNGVISSFNDSGSYGPGSAHFTGFSRSSNGGSTWTDMGKLPDSPNGDVGDPVLARSPATGTVILATLAFSGTRMQMFRSTDGGFSFGNTPADGTAGLTSGFQDKEWVTAGPIQVSWFGTTSNFYHMWRDFGPGGGMNFSRSTDDGLTWKDRQVLFVDGYGYGQGAWPVVGADGAVYAFCLFPDPTYNFYQLQFRKSVDEGLTFGPATAAANLRTLGNNGKPGLNGGFRTNTFPQVVAHPFDAKQLYMVYNDKGIPPSLDKGNIYFTQTMDGGATWSAPIQVNADATTNDQWQPVIAITPDGAALHVSWYDRRLDAGNSRFEVFGRNATISGTTVTWGVNDFRITDGSSPVVIGQDPVINTTYMSDYDQAVADNNFFYRTWSDNRGASAAHLNQPDVRFVKIPKAGPGPDLAANGYAQTGETCAPANGVPDPDEVVTVNFTVKNTGTAATTSSLTGTLSGTGVTSPSGPQNYGAIAPGASVTRSYTFRASGACGATITPTLQMQDGAINYGSLSYSMTLGVPVAQAFTNAAPITINDNAGGTPYPSNITVAGVGAYSRVQVSLNGFNHTWPADVDVLLVAPNGSMSWVISDVGGSTDAVNLTLTLDDTAATSLSGAALSTGTFKPTDFTDTIGNDIFPAGPPAGPYSASFAPFASLGAAANGTWSLYVRDDAGGDTGSFSGGWTLRFLGGTTCATCAPSADLAITSTVNPTPNVYAGQNITYTYTVTNLGTSAAQDIKVDTTVPTGTTFVSASSTVGGVITAPAVGGTGAVNCTWTGVSTPASGTQTFTMVVFVPYGAGGGGGIGGGGGSTPISNTASTTSLTADPNMANNSTTKTVTLVNISAY